MSSSGQNKFRLGQKTEEVDIEDDKPEDGEDYDADDDDNVEDVTTGILGNVGTMSWEY